MDTEERARSTSRSNSSARAHAIKSCLRLFGGTICRRAGLKEVLPCGDSRGDSDWREWDALGSDVVVMSSSASGAIRAVSNSRRREVLEEGVAAERLSVEVWCSNVSANTVRVSVSKWVEKGELGEFLKPSFKDSESLVGMEENVGCEE
ncbi:gram-negative pili assembly chaperone [Striga asiatica]|uniref:Gram-negative pili assembly chaperone n=1 Tax=Striga asiatica TaxID=4170 RepID=A0A5A7R7E2_STRAF|nr:gram-negative pili assembly chaperone [Striga asiatica]